LSKSGARRAAVFLQIGFELEPPSTVQTVVRLAVCVRLEVPRVMAAAIGAVTAHVAPETL